MSDNLPDVAETIAAVLKLREATGTPYSKRHAVLTDAASLLESLSARVTQAETTVVVNREKYVSVVTELLLEHDGELAQAKHDVWEEGHGAGWVDGQFSMGAETKAETPNPYPAQVSPGTGNDQTDNQTIEGAK